MSIAKIEGIPRLLARIKATQKRLAPEKEQSVIVGYTQAYALHVHERTDIGHKQGQAKYLEEPARQLANDNTLKKIIVDAVKGGRTLMQGLLMAGLKLQRESQLLVPVDTGALRASAFTRKD